MVVDAADFAIHLTVNTESSQMKPVEVLRLFWDRGCELIIEWYKNIRRSRRVYQLLISLGLLAESTRR